MVPFESPAPWLSRRRCTKNTEVIVKRIAVMAVLGLILQYNKYVLQFHYCSGFLVAVLTQRSAKQFKCQRFLLRGEIVESGTLPGKGNKIEIEALLVVNLKHRLLFELG